ncbi:MAG: penicillin-binding transpeptidase domain-containing protein [Bryobacteraceae bacterium]|nr:penicillin-binding transpeptidase domain-containing protein [Bryobacteraceae bacterium]
MITRRALFPALADAFRLSGAAVVLRVSDGSLLRADNGRAARQQAAAPGSAIKPWLAEALRPWRLHRCALRLRILGHRLDCSHAHLAGPLDAETAIAASCNQWFAAQAAAADPARVCQRLREGGAEAGEAAPGEELQLQVLGVANVRITAMAMARAYRRLALEADPAVMAGLRRAVVEGTAQAADAPGLEVAGKTGTSRDGAWFAGFAPASSPRFAVAVFQPGGRGGRDAAPLARELFVWAFRSFPR